MRRIFDFLDERTGYKKLLGHLLDEPVKGVHRIHRLFAGRRIAA